MPVKHKILNSVIVSILLSGIGSINEAIAFEQSVRIHIDKGGNPLGSYGVMITNMNTDVYSTDYHTDYSTEDVYIDGYMESSYGDQLQACVMMMSTSAIDCAFEDADSSIGYVDLYIYMDRAIIPQSTSTDGYYGDDSGSYDSGNDCSACGVCPTSYHSTQQYNSRDDSGGPKLCDNQGTGTDMSKPGDRYR